MRKLFTLFVISALTIGVFSQPPQKMSYQAVIRNSTGQLVSNHAVGMRISILQGSATGTAVYVETQTPTTNANGLATIEIGGGTVVSGTFTGIDWSTGIYFVKTETDPAGGTNYNITGTSQILSVPYALYSKTTGNTFSNDLVINGLTVGRGNGSIASNSAFGASVLNSNTTGNYNTAVGYHALNKNTIGKYNSAFGSHALEQNTTGYCNTAIGIFSLFFNSTASRNTAIGDSSLYSNTTGYYNTAIGNETLWKNTTGYSNVAIGIRALYNNKICSNLVAIGDSALFNNKYQTYYLDGARNTAVGSKSLFSNTIGWENTATGGQTLYSNTTGCINTATGYQALYSNKTGNSNTAIGGGTLHSSSTGHGNTATGTSALYYNLSGSFNTAIGYNAGANNQGSYNIFLGNYAGYYETGSHKLFIDNQKRANEADARVKALIYGVFDASPANQYLTINGNTIVNGNSTVTGNLQVGNSYGPITSNWWEFGTDSNNGTGIDFHSNTSPADYSARIFRTPGNDGEFQIVNTGNGNLALYTAGTQRMSITVAGNVGIGTTSPAYKLDVNGEITSRSPSGNSFRLRVGRYSTFLRNDGSDFYLLLTNKDDPDGSWNTLRPFSFNLSTGNTNIGNGALTVIHGGNVGIGTATPGTKLAIAGLTGSPAGSSLVINNGNVYYLGSTRNIKENIRPLDDDFNKILNASPVSFTDKATGMAGIGYIAEEFEEEGLQNLLVYENGELVSLRYDLISVYNLEVIKRQQKQIDEQQKQITDQQKLIEEQQKQIDELKQLVQSLMQK